MLEKIKEFFTWVKNWKLWSTINSRKAQALALATWMAWNGKLAGELWIIALIVYILGEAADNIALTYAEAKIRSVANK